MGGNISTQDLIGTIVNPVGYWGTKAAGAAVKEVISQSGLMPKIPNLNLPTGPLGGGGDASFSNLAVDAFVPGAAGGGGGGGGRDQMANSPTYSWTGIRNTTTPGAQIPIVYGEHRIGGLIASVYKETDAFSGSDALNMLLALGEGEIDGISDIEINNQPYRNYYGVWNETRLGLPDQLPIKYFNQLITEYPQNAKVTTGGFTYTTRGSAVEAAWLQVEFPGGLFATEDRTAQANYNVDLGYEAASLQGAIARATGELSQLQGDYVPGGATANRMSQLQGDIATFQALQQDIAYRQLAVSRQLAASAFLSRSVVFLIQYRAAGQSAWVTAGNQTVIAMTRSAVRRTFPLAFPGPGKYDVKISRVTPEPGGFYIVDEARLTSVDEVLLEDLAYPRTALLALRAIASDQLSGAMPTVTAIVRGRKIAVRSGGVWTTVWSQNPAWIIYDLLTNRRYGIGAFVAATQMDVDSFEAAAAWCDALVDDGAGNMEPRCRWDGVLDGNPAPWDIIQQIASTFGGVLIYSGGTYSLRVDKPEVAVQSFGMGNVIAGSVKFGYVATDKRINAIDIQYTDASQNFTMQMIPFHTSALVQNQEPVRKRQVSLLGVTRRSQAVREGNRMLNVERLIRRSIEFSAMPDAMACQVFDVINFSHDVPQWGYSGRILRATGRRVHLDQRVPVDTGVTYRLRIVAPDGTEEEKTVTVGGLALQQGGSLLLKGGGRLTLKATSGWLEWVEVDSDWTSAPAPGCLFFFGPANAVSVQFRITEIERDAATLGYRIKAVEYNPGVWVYDNVVQPGESVSLLPNPYALPDQVTGLALTERLYFDQAGGMGVAIDATWSNPVSLTGRTNYDHADVYLSNDGGVTWAARGSTGGESFALLGVQEGRNYKVAVVSVSARGCKRVVAESPTSSIYVIGKAKPPAAPTNFRARQSGGVVNLSWDKVDEIDVAGYVIREGVTYDGGMPVAELETGLSRAVPVAVDAVYRYWIKTVDTTGHYSAAVLAQVTVSGLPYNAVISADDYGVITLGGQWLLYNNHRINKNALYDTDAPDLDDLFENITDYAGQSWTSYQWDNNRKDLGKIADFRLTVKPNITATDPFLTDLSYPDRLDTTYPNDTDTAPTTGFSLQIYVATSDDDVTYTAFTPYTQGTLTARYFKNRIVITASATARLDFTTVLIVADVADVTFVVAGFSVGVGGTTLTYASYDPRTFFSAPVATPVPVGASFALPVVSNKTTTDCKITLYDAAGASISGVVDVTVDGY